jgi:hypothetical protein
MYKSTPQTVEPDALLLLLAFLLEDKEKRKWQELPA